MRLAIPSLIIFLYVYSSLVVFVPCRIWVKLTAAVILLIVSQKYLIYEQIGHSFMAPNLPTFLLHVLEILYAFLLIAIFLLLIKDIVLLANWLGRSAGLDLRIPLTPPVRNFSIAVFALFLACFGHWQSLQVPKVKTVEIELSKLPAELDGFSLIQLTDIHIGSLFKGAWLANVVDRVNQTSPDLVVVTGDMIDGSPQDLFDDIKPLSRLQALYGVFGVTGNHEYYFGSERWLRVFNGLGITMLHNEHRLIGQAPDQSLVLAGIPDRTEKRYGGPGPDIEMAFSGAPDTARILLAHQPGEITSSHGELLQLSGHTHGGHLFFMKWLISAFNGGLVDGLYHIGNKHLYVSPGTGLWAGFACRLGVQGEITHIVLRSYNADN